MNFLTKSVAGALQLVAAIAASTGVADAGKIIETDANGLIDSSLLPSGVGGSSVQNLTAGASALAAGDYVFISLAGEVELADNSNISGAAVGYVTQAYAAAATDVEVFFDGVNSGLTGLTVGSTYYLDTAGAVSTTPPAFAIGSICQRLGIAISATEILTEIDQPYEYAAQ